MPEEAASVGSVCGLSTHDAACLPLWPRLSLSAGIWKTRQGVLSQAESVPSLLASAARDVGRTEVGRDLSRGTPPTLAVASRVTVGGRTQPQAGLWLTGATLAQAMA